MQTSAPFIESMPVQSRHEPPQTAPVPPPPPRREPHARMPDGVVLEVVDRARPALAACVKRARDRDPTLERVKLDLHFELDADGAVTDAKLALDDTRLQNCVLRVVRGMHFPAPGEPALAGVAFIAN